MEGKELEVKFYLSDRVAMQHMLDSLGERIAPRVHEVNLRFDTPDRTLTSTGRVLRIRQDSRARVTYKGEGRSDSGANLRQELEFSVSDFDTAKALFEALGYQVYTMYEKYRTTYKLDNTEADLDELPTGDFLEIEGPDSDSILRAAVKLGLNWQARVLDSYTVLFDRLKKALGLEFRDLSFENFQGMVITPEQLGITPADIH